MFLQTTVYHKCKKLHLCGAKYCTYEVQKTAP